MSSCLICKDELVFLISMPERRLYIRCPASQILGELSPANPYFEYMIGDESEIFRYLQNHMAEKPGLCGDGRSGGRTHSSVSAEGMREMLLSMNEACVVYTGAGISRAAGIFTQKELITLLYLDRLPALYEILMKNPDVLFTRYQMFMSMLAGKQPTEAHNKIRMLCQRSGAALVSENLDRLHEISGILPRNPFSEKELQNWSPERVILIGIGEPQCRNLLSCWFSRGAKYDVLNIEDPQISYLDYRICLVDIQRFFREMIL